MSAEYTSTEYPAQELTKEQLAHVAREFARRAANGEQMLEPNHPLRRIGGEILQAVTRDEQLAASGDSQDPRTVITGFQVYQDFSALANPDTTVSTQAIESSAEGILAEYKLRGYKETVHRGIQVYEGGLPRTSQYLAHVAMHVGLSPEPFTAGVSLAYKLELNARYLDYLESGNS